MASNRAILGALKKNSHKVLSGCALHDEQVFDEEVLAGAPSDVQRLIACVQQVVDLFVPYLQV